MSRISTDSRLPLSMDANVRFALEAVLRELAREVNNLVPNDVFTLVDGATISVDASFSNNFRITLGGNRTLANPTNLRDGQRLDFRIKQDGTGSRTLSYGSKFAFPGGTTPTLTTTAGATDILRCQYDRNDDTLFCVLNGASGGGGSTNAFGTVAVSGQSDVVADAAPDTLTLVAGSNVTLTTNAGTDTVTIAAAQPNTFATVAVSGQSDVVADSSSDTLTLAAGSNITLTTNASTDTVTIASSGGGSGTKTYAVFTPMTSQPPASNFATLDTRNSIAVLDFDAATEESAFWVGIVPEAASLGSGLIVRIHWMATSATSGDVKWGASFERMTTDLDSDSFDTETTGTSTTSGTSGIITVTAITCTTIDSVTAGDAYRLKIARKAADGADTLSGDAEVVAVEVRSAA